MVYNSLEDVRMVEIEFSSFCNKKCSWCPNKNIDRTESKVQLNIQKYSEMLIDLRQHGAGCNSGGLTISYSRYNEPFYNIKHLKLIAGIARTILGLKVSLVANTNGNYLTKDSFVDLPLNEVSIMDYNCNGVEKCKDHLKSLGAGKITENYPYLKSKINNTDILYYVDWPKNHELENRGGLLNKKDAIESDMVWKDHMNQRKSNCLEPLYFIAIDYNGNVMPCCNMRSDSELHKKYILGNIYVNDISEIYNSKKAKIFRKKLVQGNWLFYPKACRHCTKSPGRYTRNNGGIDYAK